MPNAVTSAHETHAEERVTAPAADRQAVEEERLFVGAAALAAALPGTDGVDPWGGLDPPTRTRMMLSMQRRAGNAAVLRMVAGGRPTAVVAPVQREVLGPAGGAPLPAASATGPLAADAGTQMSYEYAKEIKGPEATGYIKLNKTSYKFKGKVSEDVPSGTPSVGPALGTTDKDGQSGPVIGFTAEDKATADGEVLTAVAKLADDLAAAVTGQDGSLKTQFWDKLKAEAKSGATETSAKVGYDVGVDATIFGVAKVTLSLSFTMVGVKFKSGGTPQLTALALSPTAATGLTVKFKAADGGSRKIEGTGEISAEFEPNWKMIIADTCVEIGVPAAIDAAVAAAALLGPVFAIGSGVLIAAEKGQLQANFLEGAKDAKSGAMVYAQIMTGSDVPPGQGPRSQAAALQAKTDIAKIAAGQDVSVEDLMTQLRQDASNAYLTVYGPAKQQAQSAFDTDVRGAIKAWRSEHPILSIWTTEDDDVAQAENACAPIFAG